MQLPLMALLMVPLLDGNLEIGAYIRNNLSYLICSMHLIRSRVVTNLIFFSPKRPVFLHACALNSELPSDINNHEACIAGTSSANGGVEGHTQRGVPDIHSTFMRLYLDVQSLSLGQLHIPWRKGKHMILTWRGRENLHQGKISRRPQKMSGA